MPLRFLADESCDHLIVRTLRSAGFDVVAISEVSSGAQDQWVLGNAVSDNRILITEDRDFGEWVFGRIHDSSGVLLIRFPSLVRRSLPVSLLGLIGDQGALIVESGGRRQKIPLVA